MPEIQAERQHVPLQDSLPRCSTVDTSEARLSRTIRQGTRKLTARYAARPALYGENGLPVRGNMDSRSNAFRDLS
jgi:hypothetical protein